MTAIETHLFIHFPSTSLGTVWEEIPREVRSRLRPEMRRRILEELELQQVPFYLLFARLCSKHFMCINPLSPQNNLVRKVLLFSPFHR